METNKVSETLNISVGNLGDNENTFLLNEIKSEIDNLPNAEDFRNAYIIMAENDSDNNYLQSCYGVTLAINALRKDNHAKVILCSFLQIEFCRNKKPEIDLVLKHDNAYFLKLLSGVTFGFENVFQSKKPVVSGVYTASQEAQKYLSIIFHDLNYVKDWNNPVDHERGMYERTLAKIRDYFPALGNATPKEIFEFLESVSDSREEVMKGKRIAGVYCDVEGTILVNEQLNQKVVTLLHEYEQQGKIVTIWTDGNIEELKQKLESFGVIYPVKSKFDHAGAIAEIVIDDQDEYTFGARTKISAEKFIKVSDIN